jgi:hypothetical protein
MPGDRPFIYAFDGSAIPDGTNLNRQIIPVEPDADFICRRVTGYGSLTNISGGGRVLLYDATSVKSFSGVNGSTPSSQEEERMIVPEIVYSYRNGIRLGITDTLRQSRTYPVGGSVPNYYSSIYWQGVKRFAHIPPYRTPYQWKHVGGPDSSGLH